MQLALYQPDIPQNVGSIIRLAACLGAPLHIIEPCGFPFDMKRIRQAALDYIDLAALHRHDSWERFLSWREENMRTGRLVLLSTKAATPLYEFTFQPDDILLFGRESAGVPAEVHARADARIVIPLMPPARSLNVSQAAAIALAEALRQTHAFHTALKAAS